MNKIIVSGDKYGNSSYKVYKLLQGDYNIGDLVEVREGGSSRFAVIVEKKGSLANAENICSECLFRNPDSLQSIPCGYTSSDGWFPCIALCSETCVSFKSVDTILEDL